MHETRGPSAKAVARLSLHNSAVFVSLAPGLKGPIFDAFNAPSSSLNGLQPGDTYIPPSVFTLKILPVKSSNCPTTRRQGVLGFLCGLTQAQSTKLQKTESSFQQILQIKRKHDNQAHRLLETRLSVHRSSF